MAKFSISIKTEGREEQTFDFDFPQYISELIQTKEHYDVVSKEIMLYLQSCIFNDSPDAATKNLIQLEENLCIRLLGVSKSAATNAVLVDRGAHQLVLNVLRRAGKNEVADAFEEASTAVDASFKH